MNTQQAALVGIHLFVRDLDAALRFYSLLGFEPPRRDEHFAHIDLPNGLALQLGTYALTRGYDSGWVEPSGSGTNALQFSLSSRDAVDELYARVTAAGYEGRLAPFDAFWGARYAEVVDADGNILGFHSPSEEERRSPPPAL